MRRNWLVAWQMGLWVVLGRVIHCFEMAKGGLLGRCTECCWQRSGLEHGDYYPHLLLSTQKFTQPVILLYSISNCDWYSSTVDACLSFTESSNKIKPHFKSIYKHFTSLDWPRVLKPIVSWKSSPFHMEQSNWYLLIIRVLPLEKICSALRIQSCGSVPLNLENSNLACIPPLSAIEL